jgi:uncharacterized protein (TIGR02145 family)
MTNCYKPFSVAKGRNILVMIITTVIISGGCRKNESPVIIVTGEITALTTNSAMSGGMIVYGEEADITEMGLVWSIRHDPSVRDYSGKISRKGEYAEFPEIMTGLDHATRYYVRAYAIRGSGISYGDEKSFKTYYGSVADFDGNIYYTIKTNGQEWMSSNLATGRYNSGDIIPNIRESDPWPDLSTGAWASYNNNDNMQQKYGNLYNWYAVNDARGLCPAGWSVPSDTDWKELETYLGLLPEHLNQVGLRGTYAGGKLKESGTKHWRDPNAIATDEIGFSALPGGFRHFSGEFYSLGEDLYLWTSTGHGDNAWYRNLVSESAGIYRNISRKTSGFYVRCVRKTGD